MKYLFFALVAFFIFPKIVLAQSPIFTPTVTTPDVQPGFYFATPGNQGLAIMDRFGVPLFYRDVSAYNLERQGDRLTYFNRINSIFEVLDRNYNLIDTWEAVDSETDPHELVLLSNGNALFTTYRWHTPYDLSPYGGPVTGTVVSCVIQELDQGKNLVWEWDGLNYNPITHTIANLTRPRVDYDHCNAYDIDNDGGLLISHRNLNQITKIDRVTGDVVWKLGGVANEFTFTNDAGFALQHDIRRLDNGHITLFDNGNFSRGYSRAIEYEINEATKLITRTWEFTGPFTGALGSVRVQPNDNVLIGWGLGSPTIQEVKRDGEIVFEADIGASYRVIKDSWFTWTYLPVIVTE